MRSALVEELESRRLLAAVPVPIESLTPVSAQNGWGPIEPARSNGGQAAGDGQTITLNGVAYSAGLGTHANAEVVYRLDGAYGTFISDIGIDDEVGDGGVGEVRGLDRRVEALRQRHHDRCVGHTDGDC